MDRLIRNFLDSRKAITRLLLVNVIAQSGIIVTGAIVRITKSGLGCPTWPQCVGDSIVPLHNQPESWHKYVEFGNRLLTIVLLVVGIMVLFSVWKTQSSSRFRLLAVVPMLGTLIQAILGGITVLTGLHPTTVSAHFLVSIVIVALSYKLFREFSANGNIRINHNLANLLTFFAFLTIVLGTLVTGSGPHSGDLNADSRFGFDISTIANIHAKSVLFFCLIFGIMVFRYYKNAPKRTKYSFNILALLVLIQALLGHYQFANGLPEIPVLLHVLGSVSFWIATLRLRFDFGSVSLLND